MIDEFTNLQVRVRDFRTQARCKEYNISPQSPLYTKDARHQMIVATANKRFDIELSLLKDFNFKGCRYVRAKVDLDGGVLTMSKHILNNAIRQREGNDSCYKYQFRYMKGRKADGTWTNFGLAFADLMADARLVLSTEEVAKQATNRGKITVTVQRGHALRTEEETPEDVKYKPLPSSYTSEKVIKEHYKTHSFKRVLGGQTVKPDLEKWHFTPADGEAGKPVVYTFTYVSKEVVDANKERVLGSKHDGELAQSKITDYTTQAPMDNDKQKKHEVKQLAEPIDLCSDDEEAPDKVGRIELPEIDAEVSRTPFWENKDKDTTTKAVPAKALKTSTTEKDAKTSKNKTIEPIVDRDKPAMSTEAAKTSRNDSKRTREEIMEKLEEARAIKRVYQLERELRELDGT